MRKVGERLRSYMQVSIIIVYAMKKKILQKASYVPEKIIFWYQLQ